MYRPLILSRHPSHAILRRKNKKIAALPVPSVVRFGSSTEVLDTVAKGGNRVEINTVASIKISANKLLMKQKFNEAGVKTAKWYHPNNIQAEDNFESNSEGIWGNSLSEDEKITFPIVAKAHYGSKGNGNTLINSLEEFQTWMQGKTLSNYIFEKFHNYGHEFRLHITEEGCFYACRKALKKDIPAEEKWHFHDSTCVWFLESNENFYKPNSWNDIINDCVKALKAIGADILSFDVKVQSPKDKDGNLRPYQEYILLECNSASSMGDYDGKPSICAEKYINVIPRVILNKIKNG
jgi:glutathione synthase/RimK-type ligase-like ATP-grasp enzyme